jgi:hypothetical protein
MRYSALSLPSLFFTSQIKVIAKKITEKIKKPFELEQKPKDKWQESKIPLRV